jgi:hypothetical protein
MEKTATFSACSAEMRGAFSRETESDMPAPPCRTFPIQVLLFVSGTTCNKPLRHLSGAAAVICYVGGRGYQLL